MSNLTSLIQKYDLMSIFKKLVYFFSLFCFLVLAITGFYPRFILGCALSGYILMIHVIFAGAFACCLALSAILFASQNRFKKEDLSDKKSSLLKKIAFWLILITALPVIISILLMMFPIFGTHGQHVLIDIHRYTSLFLAVIILIHTCLLVFRR